MSIAPNGAIDTTGIRAGIDFTSTDASATALPAASDRGFRIGPGIGSHLFSAGLSDSNRIAITVTGRENPHGYESQGHQDQ
jgi:hypothetical protein